MTDMAELQELVVNTISHVCKEDYSSDQIAAWISSVRNKERWTKKWADQLLLIAHSHEHITGICTLRDGNYIDLFYIHKDHQRQGIGKLLYAEIEKEAEREGQSELTSDVNIAARPFFERLGFELLKEQLVIIQGVGFTNFKMAKTLDHESK